MNRKNGGLKNRLALFNPRDSATTDRNAGRGLIGEGMNLKKNKKRRLRWGQFGEPAGVFRFMTLPPGN